MTFPSFSDYNLRWEIRKKNSCRFSILFWIYIDEYCLRQSPTDLCAVLQHLTFNLTYLTPELFINREGQLVVHMFGYLYDLKGDNARTSVSIPKKDWCRVLFVVEENTVNIEVCIQS